MANSRIPTRVALFIMLAVLVGVILASCSNSVSVSKQPLAVSYRYIEDEPDKSRVPLTKDEEAATFWRFGCKTDFDFDVVEKTELGKNDYLVTIKIRKVHLVLTAPVDVWISKTAAPEVVRHENAHVEICKRVYDKINDDAVKAGNIVIGKEYQASGASVEAACKSAIERAAQDVYSRYHSTATTAVNRVSGIFDELEANKTSKDEVKINEAFAKYRRTEGTAENARDQNGRAEKSK